MKGAGFEFGVLLCVYSTNSETGLRSPPIHELEDILILFVGDMEPPPWDITIHTFSAPRSLFCDF